MQEETLEKYKKGELLYNQGLSPKEIGEQLKVSVTRFRTWLKNKGYDTGYKCLPIYEKGMEMYISGTEISTEKIAKQLKISRKRFAQWMRCQGVVITNSSIKYSCDENFFENINTEEKAYWLGFLYADGSINERRTKEGRLKSIGLEINLNDKDYSHLEKFNKSIKGNYKITTKVNKLKGKEYNSCRISIGCTKMCRDLIKLGCTPRKSLTLVFPTEEQVPKEFVRHFVRGYVDGDGSVMFSTNKKYSRLSIISTEDFLYECRDRMGWKTTNAINCSGSCGKAYILEYNGKYVLDYLKTLYENSNIQLDRKYKKYKEILAHLNSTLQKN